MIPAEDKLCPQTSRSVALIRAALLLNCLAIVKIAYHMSHAGKCQFNPVIVVAKPHPNRSVILQRLCCTILWVSLSSLLSTSFAEVPTAESLEESVVRYRQEHMSSGRVVLQSIDLIESGEHAQQTECEYSVTFDKELMRFDRKCRLKNATSWGTTSKYAIGHGIYIEDLVRYVVVEVDKVSGGIRPGGYEGVVFHPNTLGLYVGGISSLRRTSLESFVNKADRNDVTVAEEKVGDQRYYTINYDRLNGYRVSMSINPSRGYAVESIKERKELAGLELTMTEMTEYVQYGQQGIWYPKESTFRRTMNGKVEVERKVTVLNADFDSKVDASLFTIAGFDLEDGRVVSDNTSGVPVGKVWKGGKLEDLVATDSGAHDHESLSPNRGFRSSLFLWLNAIVCVSLAILLLIRKCRQRPSQ